MNENNTQIDALVRERLQSLPAAAPPPGGWAALQRELDGDADLLLRSALVGLSASAAPSGWEALERKMEPQAAADQQIADDLNGLEPEVVTGWPALADRLDRLNDKAVDAIVSDGLARTVPVATSGWAALAARLELIGWRRSTLAAWKLTESCLLLSLVLLFLRFGPATPSSPTFADLVEGFSSPLTATIPGNATETMTTTAATISEDAAAVQQPEVPMVTEKVATIIKDLAPLRAKQAPAPEAEAPAARTVLSLPKTEPAPVETTINVIDVQIAEATVLRENVYLPDNVIVLDIDKLKTSQYLPSPALKLPARDESEPIYYYLNAFVSPVDLNQVITPDAEIDEVDISADRRFTYGSSGGLMLDIAQGKNALQVGAIYARRSYIPSALKWWREDEFPLVEPLKGYSRFVFESIDFQLNYKRSLIETSKWRFSGRIGMSLNIVAYSDFVGKDQFVTQLNDFLEDVERFAPPSSGTAGRSNNTLDERRLVDPANGWWEGGSALENSSLYANGGFVLERLMNERWSVYVSPSFSRVVYLKRDQGIGPFKDRINPFALRFGSRYHFGGK